jgi:hypothetical protein
MLRAALPVLCFAAACGGGSPPAAPPPPPSNQPSITISAAGVVSPKELTVAPGTRVLFINNDTRRHNMTSDLHPDHLECEEINQVGLLIPGQRKETGNLNTIRSCGFHDHDNFPNDALQGRIIVR